MSKKYDVIIIGGGFFGLSIANYLSRQLKIPKILVIEKEDQVMTRASLNNQARVHGGYHYPRSLLTGLRSQVNFPNFVNDYKEAIVDDFEKYYAVAYNFSKVSAKQFQLFSQRIGAEIKPADNAIKKLFNNRLIEDVVKVREYAFNADILRQKISKDISETKVDVLTGVTAKSVKRGNNNVILVTSDGKSFEAKNVFSCAYSMLNIVNANSKLPLLPLKHELTEMALIELPDSIKNLSVTVMCGPFFSFMPFPTRKLTTLSHVRYTPHSEWLDNKELRNGHEYLENIKRVSHFPAMIKDASRYMPSLSESVFHSSIWEIKTVLTQSEIDDSRPILFMKNHGIKGYHCILGAKLDNVYDVFHELELMYA